METYITSSSLGFQMGAMEAESSVGDIQQYVMTIDDSWGNYRVVLINVHLN